MFTDACLRHLLCHGSCSSGNVHVSHPGQIYLIMLPGNIICSAYMQEGVAIKAERMKKKITGGKKKVEIDEIKVTIRPRIISYDCL